MSFRINQNSQSFRFLARHDSNIKCFADANDWQLADPTSYVWEGVPRTFCDYYRCVAKNMFGFAFVAFILALLGLFVISPVLFLIPHFMTVADDLVVVPIFGSAIDIAAVAVVGFAFIKEKVQEYRYNHPSSNQPKARKEPGPIVTAYKSWKGKFCPLVEYDFVAPKVENYHAEQQGE